MSQQAIRSEWAQVDLIQVDGRSIATLLPEVIATLRRDEVISRWFYMRKPPGLLVRFQVVTQPRDAAAAIGTALDSRIGPSGDGSWRWGSYEPETEFLGCTETIDAIHWLFAADSELFLGAFAEPLEQRLHLSIQALSVLFGAFGLDAPESWDVFSRVRVELGRSLNLHRDHRMPVLDYAGEQIREIWRSPSSDARLAPYATQVYAGVRAWRKAIGMAPFQPGARRSLSRLTIFQWNRAGIPPWLQAAATEVLAHEHSFVCTCCGATL